MRAASRSRSRFPAAAIERATEILQSGRLHRYNTVAGETSEAALLELDFRDYIGARYCLAVASGGYAMTTALRAAGLRPGEPVLTNSFTLSPVPGAIAGAGGKPIFVETTDALVIDLDDLAVKARSSKSRFLLLSHMRGHIADMEALTALCDQSGLKLIEDCAHTMGASWNGVKSGRHGLAACYSTQTYKHINSGEGGFIVSDDAELWRGPPSCQAPTCFMAATKRGRRKRFSGTFASTRPIARAGWTICGPRF